MKKKILVSVLVVILLLIFPLIVKDRSNPLARFEGPQLSSLKYTEINFTNTYDATKLAGMLFLPDGEGPFPTAIIIHGSGYSNRENTWYLALVAHLQNSGIAVLLPDKRGSEKSEGDWIGADIELLATDTESAVQFIKDQELFAASGIGLVGVSQGGWIAPVVAGKPDGLSYVVNISGTMATGDKQLVFEEYHNISLYTYSFIARLIAPVTSKKLKKKKSVAPFIDFDPVPYWKKVDIPAFIAYGENDTNCPVDISLKLVKEHNMDHLWVKEYPNGKHGILNADKTRISPDFLADLSNFIKKNH